MLADVIKTFNKKYKEKGDAYITDSYVPADGEYIIIDTSGEEFNILDRINIKQDKKTKEIDGTNPYFDFIRKADYMSKLIDMNKPIDSKKIIHSNNYLSFFVKKENVNNGKLNNKIIDDYYDILKNPLLKYNKSNAKKLYIELENKNGKADEKRIEKIKEWIKNNIYDLVAKDSKDKTYLKIFFDYDLEEYRKESEKYILTNIYNSNDFNVTIDEHIYGLPNDNMGLNSKKPYLENKSRKTKVPYLLSQDEVLIQKKFFDYLMNQVSIGNTNIYINEDDIKPLSNDKTLNEDFSGYYLRIKKGKEVEIHDFDTIGLYKSKIDPLSLINALQLEKSKINYGNIYTLDNLKNIINEVFFSKFLASNYFTEAKDLNINDISLKRNLLLARTTLFRWFYKGNWNSVWKVLDTTSLDLIKGSINNGYLSKASEQFNLRISLKSYFGGGKNMADVLMNVKNSLREKISQNQTASIENDREYYFAVGQLASYFISLSKSKKKVHSLANPIINAKTDKRIKEQLERMFNKYNYDIDDRIKKFKNLYAMTVSYEPDGKIEKDLIIAGYLHSNLIYEKSIEEEN
ncbi:type I-B CRISPR-associated protein Cas8b/Csh1 [Clostridium sp. JNZ J1-5]